MKRGLLTFFALIAAIFMTAGPASAEGELARALKTREEFFKSEEAQGARRNWQSLITEFENAALAQDEPRHASRARFVGAQLALDSAKKFKVADDYKKAENLARRAVRDCPRCAHAPEAQLIHGQALFELKELEEADRQLMKVELNYPESREVAAARELLAKLRGVPPPKPSTGGAQQASPAKDQAKDPSKAPAAKPPSAKDGAAKPKPPDPGLKKPPPVKVPPMPKARADGRAQVYFLSLEDFGKYTRVTAYVDKVAPYVYNLIPPAREGGAFRAYADVKGAVIAPRAALQLKEKSPLVKLVKMNQFAAEVVRLIIDLPQAHPYMPVFVDKPPRLIFSIAKEAKNLPSTAPEAQPDPPEKKPAPPPKPRDNTPAAQGPADSLARQLGLKVRSIVIDPGHGGKDVGASGAGLREKDITLKLAQKLKSRLEKRLGLTVHLTRSEDKFISLERRGKISREKKADLFISLHVNANSAGGVQGFETYILNFATDRSAMAVAARENASGEKSVSELEDVLQSIAKNTKISESRAMAQALHKAAVKSLNTKYKVRDLGVKEAPFFVLVDSGVPAALVEIGFITNKDDADRLKTEAYLDQTADGLADGLAAYVKGFK